MILTHRGRVRGGNNEYARFFLQIVPPHFSDEEAAEAGRRWSEEFGFESRLVRHCDCDNATCQAERAHGCRFYFVVETRAEFSRAASIIRKAQAIGWHVSTYSCDGGFAEVFLDQSPDVFWRELALAQMFVQE